MTTWSEHFSCADEAFWLLCSGTGRESTYGKDGVRDDNRGCDGYYKADIVFDHQNGDADAAGFSVCGSGGQYFSDCNLHSGADAYLCAQDYMRVYFDYFFRQLDYDVYCRIYDGALVQL